MRFEAPSGTIPARGFDWDEVRFPPRLIGEVVELRYGKALVERKRRPGAVPMFGTNGQCGWHDTPLSPGPGVILGRKGQGHLGVKWCETDFWVIDTAYYAQPDRSEVDLLWLYYITKYVGLDHLKTGEKPGLSRDIFGRQLFPFPLLEEQRAIAAVLRALDDKVKANRTLNETLEATCQALFRSWFVDFDPVIAKSDGRRPPHLSDKVAALFPDAFQESSIGPIPYGWDVEPLDKVADFTNGLALQKYPPELGGDRLPVIKIAQLRAGTPDDKEWASPSIGPKYTLDDGDLVFSWSGTLMVKIWCGGPGALNQHLFKVTSERFPKWFCHQWLMVHLPEFQAIASDKATTMGHIRRHHLADAKCVIPRSSLLEAADKVLAPALSLLIARNVESRTLAALRDMLLPRLLSGELRVRQAEKLVEAAV